MKITKLIPLLMLTYLSPVFCSTGEGETSTSFFKNPWVLGGIALLVVVIIAYIIYSRRDSK